jgi:hypothetical protein
MSPRQLQPVCDASVCLLKPCLGASVHPEDDRLLCCIVDVVGVLDRELRLALSRQRRIVRGDDALPYPTNAHQRCPRAWFRAPSPAVAPTVCWRVSKVEVCCPAGCGVSSGYHDTAIDRPVENTCWHHLHSGSATESRVCPKSRMESRSARTKSHCGLGGAERAWSLARLDWAARSAGRPPVLPSSQLFSLTLYTLVQQHQRH